MIYFKKAVDSRNGQGPQIVQLKIAPSYHYVVT